MDPPSAPPRDHRLGMRSAQRRLGAFYTGDDACRAMAAWALRGSGEHVLEPSFGGGAFLRAVRSVVEERGWEVGITGVELDEQRCAVPGVGSTRKGDFLAIPPFPVDVVLGNPPYVRLRHLPADQEATARAAGARGLGSAMDPSGSVWMPFVLHALRFLREGGRLALVLPFELTHVRYARPLWRVLGATFRSLRVVRVRERLFPEVLQEAIVLYADGFGGSTATVEFVALETAAAFVEAAASPARSVPVGEILAGERAFARALLDPGLLELLDGPVHARTLPVRALCAFHVGYVTGHKAWFHPDPATIERFHLPPTSLRPAVANSRALTGVGLHTTGIPPGTRLFLPEPGRLSEGERRYLAAGEEAEVHLRYKCRVRDPWFVVPDVRVPDLVLSVFSERPVVLVNDARLVATNSLLCGHLRAGSAESFVGAWYTSLTPLLCELEVHALGGGVLVLIPGEVARVRVAVGGSPSADHLGRIRGALRARRVADAYAVGDDPILHEQLGLDRAAVEKVREGAAVLQAWRTSGRGAAAG